MSQATTVKDESSGSETEFGAFIGVEPMRCPNCNNISFEPYDEFDHCGAYCAAKGINITCWGCRESQANQLAHMDYGGCCRAVNESANSSTDKKDEPQNDLSGNDCKK